MIPGKNSPFQNPKAVYWDIWRKPSNQINSNTCLQNKDVMRTTFQPPRHFVVTSWYRECESNPGRLQLAATVAESSWGCEKTWDRNIHPPFAKCSLEDLAICDFWHLLRLDDQRQKHTKIIWLSICPMSDCVYDIFRSCAKDGNLAVTVNWIGKKKPALS